MSYELEQPTVNFGATVAQFVAPPGEVMLTETQAAQRLADAFQILAERDQQSNDLIVEYIQGCKTWSSYTREGSSNNHYVIDTYLEHDDGSASYIAVDYTFPLEEAHDNKTVRERMQDILLRWTPGETIDDADIADYIVNASEYASVWHFTAEAVSLLQDDAEADTNLLDILRLRYRQKTVIEPKDCKDGTWQRPFSSPHPSWWDETLTYKITTASVALKGHVKGEDVAWFIDNAKRSAASNAIENATHAEEYHGLYNRYRYDDTLSDEERESMAQRMQEIQAGNGAPEGTHFLNWPYTLVPELNGLREVMNSNELPWDQAAVNALYENLCDTGLYLYERVLRTRAIMARHIEQLQLASKTMNELDT